MEIDELTTMKTKYFAAILTWTCTPTPTHEITTIPVSILSHIVYRNVETTNELLFFNLAILFKIC